MTITPSADSRRVVVAFARLALESFTADHTRENIAALLPLWHGYAIMTDDERADVLAAYPVGDPEPVPGVDYFPEQVAADAAVIVAETLADLPYELGGRQRRWRDREGDIWVESSRGPDSVQRILPDGSLDPRFPDREDVEREHGPLSEVTAQPAGEVWDDSVPPGGFVCAVCRVPVESEPCPEHGTVEDTAQPTGEQVQP